MSDANPDPTPYIKTSESRRDGWQDITTISAGYARALIVGARAAGELDQPGTANRQMTRGQVLDTIERSLAPRKDEEPCRVVTACNLYRELGLPLGRLGQPWGE